MDKQTIEVASLGRPFSLGALYDCRNYSLLTGLSLWDNDHLLQHIGERPQYYTDFEIVASESTEDRSSALNVDVSLELSVFFGLISVEGSAKYLTDYRKSKKQARVTLKYEATTKFQELSMDHLGANNIKYREIIKTGTATHVVTGILYGARAFFVFDREVSEEENYEEIQGNLKSLVKLLPCIKVKSDGSMKLEEQHNAAVDKLSCKFIGDFSLETNPLTYQDAVQVYRNLPNLLGANKENVVPLKVWMLPLTYYDPSAPKPVRHICTELVHKIKRVQEDITDLEMRCNDALKTKVAQQFPEINKNLKAFQKWCSDFKEKFQQALVEKLFFQEGPAAVPEEVFTSFSVNKLTEWMDWEEKEIYFLKYVMNMKNTKTISSKTELDVELLSRDHTVCFLLTSPLSNYLEQILKTDDPQHPHDHDGETRQRFSSALDTMRHKGKLFSDFAEANEDNSNIQFLTMGLAAHTKGTRIRLYKDGRLITEDFEPPSKPEIVIEGDVTHNSVRLNIHPAQFGAENITCYSFELRVSGESKWKTMRAAAAGEVTVSSLTANTEYTFRCRAETSIGVGPARESSESIKTLPTSPPGKLHVKPSSREIEVTWEKPAEVGHSVHILNYIIEYAPTDSGATGKDLHWNQILSTAETEIISGLQPETDCSIRVRCDCGAAGRSKESVCVNVCTTRSLPELLKSRSHCLKSGSPSVYKLPLTEEHMDIAGCRSYSFGTGTDKQNRTIILLGATGAGKSTLINTMINYIVGVEWRDDFRFKLTDEGQYEPQTSEVTVYRIHHQEGFQIPFALTIVDTPGCVRTRGTEMHIRQQLGRLFTSATGVCEIDAVCVVAPAAVTHITPSQKSVFESMLPIFGKDVLESIKVLLTFADGKRSSVLETLSALGLQAETHKPTVHFKFNNSALFECKSAENGRLADDAADESLNEMLWSMSIKSLKRFFVDLNETNTKSLALTTDVLREREELEDSVRKLQKLFTLGLDKQEEIRAMTEILECCETEITRPHHSEFEFTVRKRQVGDISSTGHSVNCLQCRCTCHYPHKIQKHAIEDDGYCAQCPGKCRWTEHVCQDVRERRTASGLKEKYALSAAQTKKAVRALVEELQSEYESVQDEMSKLIQTSDKCLHRLEEIALKPAPGSTPEHIHMLIEGEKCEAQPGWRERVHSLMVLKEETERMAEVRGAECCFSTKERDNINQDLFQPVRLIRKKKDPF